MVTLEPLVAKDATSWDSAPNQRYNRYTCAGAEEFAPGAITPLVADLLRRVDHLGIGELRQRIGIEGVLALAEPPVANYLAVFGGRLALDEAWQEGFRGTWATGDDGPGAAEVGRRVHSSFWPQCAAAIDRNNEKVTAAKEKLAAAELSKAAPAALWQRLETLGAMQAHLWANHLGVTAAAAEYAMLTAKLLSEELGDGFETGTVAGLTAGLDQVERSRAEIELWKFGRLVVSKPAMLQSFETLDERQLLALVAAPPDPDWRSFGRRLRDFLEVHGYRCAQEAAPSAVGWSEDPAPVLQAIQRYAQLPEEADPAALAAEKQVARQRLEAELASRITRARKREFLRTAGLAQHYLRNRERTKACWVRSVRLSRPILLELGNRMAAQGVCSEQADVFYVTLSEAGNFVHGGGVALHDDIAGRRREGAEPTDKTVPTALEAIEARGGAA